MSKQTKQITKQIIKRAGIAGMLFAYAIVVLLNIVVLFASNNTTLAASAIHVRIIGASKIIAEEQIVHATTAFDAVEQVLKNNDISYEATHEQMEQGESVFVKEVAGEKNWLYQVNGWTPPCMGINAYAVQPGDTVELYSTIHQYTTHVQLTSAQKQLREGEKWNMNILTQEPIKNNACEKPQQLPWSNNTNVALTIIGPGGSVQQSISSGTGSITLRQEGVYKAFVWQDGFFPSETITVNVIQHEDVLGNQKNIQSNEQETSEAQELKSKKDNVNDLQQPTQMVNQSNNSNSTKNQKPSEINRSSYALLPRSEEQRIAQVQQSPQAQAQEQQQRQQDTQTTLVQRQRINETLEHAAQYLLAQQNEEGLIENASLNTWAILALTKVYGTGHKETDAVIAAHESYLSTIDDITVLEAEKNIMLAAALEKNPKNFGGVNIEERLRRYFDGEQIGDTESLNDDIWGIIALRSMNVDTNEAIIEKPKEMLLNNQREDGGFSYAKDTISDTDDTAAAIMALLTAGVNENDEHIVKAFSYIESAKHTESGGYKYAREQNEPSSITTAWVIQALRAGGRPVPETAIAYIRDFQHEDGSFHAVQNEQLSKVMTTALCIPALAGTIYPLNAVPKPLQRIQEQPQEQLETVQNALPIKAEQKSEQISQTSTQEGVIGKENDIQSEQNATEKRNGGNETEQLKFRNATLERNIAQWKRANTILMITIIVMSVGIVIYGILFHTNVFKREMVINE